MINMMVVVDSCKGDGMIENIILKLGSA